MPREDWFVLLDSDELTSVTSRGRWSAGCGSGFVFDPGHREQWRARVREDLTGEIRGQIETGPILAQTYARGRDETFAEPIAIIFPETVEDVSKTVRFAAEGGLPVACRGAGTSGAVNIHGPGLGVDCARHLRKITAVTGDLVTVEAGGVLDQINAALAPGGRYFPIDSHRSAFATIGGLAGIDATGSRACRFGSVRDHLAEAELVVSNGDVVRMRPTPIGNAEGAADTPGSLEARRLSGRVCEMIGGAPAGNVDPILRGLSDGALLNLQRLVAGAEGTLGIVTSVTLQTMPVPAARAVLIALFPSMGMALAAATSAAELEPSACDLLDRRILSLAREAHPRYFRMIPVIAEAALLIEQTAPDERGARERLELVRRCVDQRQHPALAVHDATTTAEAEFLWDLPRRTLPRLASLPGRERPVLFAEGCLLPRDQIAPFLHEAQQLLQHHRVTAACYGPLFAGGLSFQPFLDRKSPGFRDTLAAIDGGFLEILAHCGGTLARHRGQGRFRLGRPAGASFDGAIPQGIRGLFDPTGRFATGAIEVESPLSTVPGNHDSEAELPAAGKLVEMQLRWSLTEAAAASSTCHGCGLCRSTADDTRMCPLFRLDATELAAPRAKARLLQQVADGWVGARELASREGKRIADLCFNCKQCEQECPSKVPVSRMMLEAKAAFVSENGLKRADWILSRAHSWGGLGTATSMFSNWLIRTPTARWLIEAILGISRHRKLPLFARRSFLASMPSDLRRKPRSARRDDTVVLYIDHFANYHDPDLARAAVEILRKNGREVFVPPEQRPSGMAMISAGDLDAARDLATENVRALGEWAREGYRIVCIEPTSAVAFRNEYPFLLDHPDVSAVAANTVEIGAYLQELHRHGRLDTRFQPVRLEAGYHEPCHLRALGAGRPLLDLIQLIPELKVHCVEKGCSGMAGAFGLTRENFAASIQIGWPLISRMRVGDFATGLTECSGCKLQMEQGTPTPTLHPLLILAWAYGFLPETRSRLRASRPALIVS